MEKMCLVVTPEIRKLTENITKSYPIASQRENLTADKVAEWVGAYNGVNGKETDFIPDFVSLVNCIEKKRNMDGKSFLAIPESIVYTPDGKQQQTYTVIGNKIFNKDGKEVFSTPSKDRRRVFANLAVQNGRAVVVEHQGKKYVVNDREQIISVATGDEMQWGNENGDRREILRLAQNAFREKQKAASATATSQTAPEAANTINQENNRSNNEESVTMSNTLSTAIKTGSWNKEAVEELTNYIKELKNEKIDIEQRVGEGRSLSQGKSEIHEGASLVLRTDDRTSQERRGNSQEQYENDAKEGREQEKRLEAWRLSDKLCQA